MAIRKDIVDGLPEVIKNIDLEIKKVVGRGLDGMLAAALEVQKVAQKKTPVEFGFLKNSAGTRIDSKYPPEVSVFFSTKYALFVHENTEMKLKGKKRPSGKGSYWNPGEARFLANAVIELRNEIPRIVADYARIK